MEHEVWFNTEAKQVGGGYESGTLRIDPGTVTLETKGGTIGLTPIHSVGRRRVSLWLNWVDLEYGPDGDARHIYMGDRRMLGWAGIVGSNTKIAQELAAARA